MGRFGPRAERTARPSAARGASTLFVGRMKAIARVLVLACLGWVVLGVAVPGTSSAQIAITSFDGSVSNPDGSPATQAGTHPDATVGFTFPGKLDSRGDIGTVEDPKDITVDLPAGLIGNPQATSQCQESALETGIDGCPIATQVGIVHLSVTWIAAPTANEVFVPLYNMIPPPGVPGEFAFNFAGVLVRLDARVDPSRGNAISLDVRGISSGLGVLGTSATLWGVPNDPSHDALRSTCLDFFNGTSSPTSNGLCPSGAQPVPFLTNPTDCSTGPVTTTMTATSWQDPNHPTTASFVSHDNGTPSRPLGPDGCDRLSFSPSLKFSSMSSTAAGPSGFAVDLAVPQNNNPVGLAESELKKAVVTLPQGVTVSPSAADGLGACSVDQIAVTSSAAPTCPDSSKIGSVHIDTPLLASPLVGSIYLAQPTPDQLLKIYLVASADGVTIKLPGTINTPDPNSSQLTATFDNNPQLPFSLLHLEFNGGPRASLNNPPTCGTYTTDAQLTAWSGQVVDSKSSFTINQGANGGPCAPLGFAPSFSAGTVNPSAGKASPLTLTFSRGDGDQALKDIAVNLPQGLLGNISAAVLCPDGAANAGTCTDVSKIGTATIAAGPGSTPLYLTAGQNGKSGQVYITGPYGGAPFGLSIVVPAIAGPFNLGPNGGQPVVVRAAIFVDRHTSALRIVSDPLPTILRGIPLQIRSVNITVDKPGFMFNPTSCSATNIGATIGSAGGASANVGSRFQVGGCSSLPFKPKLTIRAGGKGHLGARASTPLKVVVSMPKGNANLKSAEVTLPSSLNAHLGALQHPCAQADFDRDKCGPLAKIGTASAVTPVLRDPLRGGVYFVTNPRRGSLPYMEVQLRGQVAIDLRATIKTNPLVETQFTNIPDVPISRFTLNLVSGKQGPVGVRTNLCRSTSVVTADFKGASGRTLNARPKLTVAGCGKAKPAAKKKAKK